jgi:hypothetical protein
MERQSAGLLALLSLTSGGTRAGLCGCPFDASIDDIVFSVDQPAGYGIV